jgi:hypothetical protein
MAVVSVANTNFDGTGTIVELFEAGPNGSRIDNIAFCAQGSTTAGLLTFFVREDDQSTWRCFFASSVPAVTVSTTQWPHLGSAQPLNWVLKGGVQVGVATTVANTVLVHVALAGDF